TYTHTHTHTHTHTLGAPVGGAQSTEVASLSSRKAEDQLNVHPPPGTREQICSSSSGGLCLRRTRPGWRHRGRLRRRRRKRRRSKKRCGTQLRQLAVTS